MLKRILAISLLLGTAFADDKPQPPKEQPKQSDTLFYGAVEKAAIEQLQEEAKPKVKEAKRLLKRQKKLVAELTEINKRLTELNNTTADVQKVK